MPENALQHRRIHNLLLLQRLLSLREGSSPFTLIQDTIERPAHPLIQRYIHNAKTSHISTIFISFRTLRQPQGITHFIPAHRLSPSSLQSEIQRLLSPSTTTTTTTNLSKTSPRTLLIIDSLSHLCSPSPSPNPNESFSLSPFLSSLILPTKTLLAVYHTDIPIAPPATTTTTTTSSSSPPNNPYAPDPLTTLHYLATTILTLHSLPQVLAKKRAKDLARPEPVFGIGEEREGVVVGLGAREGGLSGGGSERIGGGGEGYVLEMQHRRRSGREVREMFVVPFGAGVEKGGRVRGTGGAGGGNGGVGLLEDHALFNPKVRGGEVAGGEGGGEGVEDGTFSLGLTEKQRRDREGVVLPYFDAQRVGGEGEEGVQGGRILYDMGVEDDFDEEEDEI